MIQISATATTVMDDETGFDEACREAAELAELIGQQIEIGTETQTLSESDE